MMKILALLVTLAACTAVPPTAIVEQNSENDVCNYPFFTYCYPLDPNSGNICGQACYPKLGYCPEYTISEMNHCYYGLGSGPCGTSGYIQPMGCDNNCYPDSPHKCLEGAAALQPGQDGM